MIWLGDRRGYLSDWCTQQWVRATGRSVRLSEYPWLLCPAGHVRGVGPRFFHEYALGNGLNVVDDDTRRGLLPSIAVLHCDGVNSRVAAFYEHTSEYELDAWSEWSAVFRPFGRALAVLFSRRLQQLNVPLSGLDTSRGITSRILHLVEPQSGKLRFAAWVRELVGTKNLLYAGAYSACELPAKSQPFIKVAFPLPNGAAIVMMRTQVHSDGSLTVISAGDGFGDAGFYFVVAAGPDSVCVRYVRALTETIHVYAAEEGIVRADHVLQLWGRTFLQLHYRMRRTQRASGTLTSKAGHN
jgi:hypothetical protein